MIWIDDGAGYHTSKMTTKWCQKFGLYVPSQSPDLNPIENLWRIIKTRVSTQRHRIHSLEEMIQEEWDKLTEDFRKCIESPGVVTL